VIVLIKNLFNPGIYYKRLLLPLFLLGLATTFIFGSYQMGFAFILLFSFGAVFLVLALLTPELLAVLFLSAGVLKEWVQTNIPLFQSVDFTLMMAFLSIVSIFIYRLRKNKLFDIPLDISFLPFFLFSIFLLIGNLYSPSPEYAQLKSSSFFIFNGLLFFTPVLFIDSSKKALHFIWWYVAIAVPVVLYTLIHLLTSYLSGDILEMYRATFMGVNPIKYANWLGSLTVLLLCVFQLLKSKLMKSLHIFIISILIISILAANSRGPFVGFIITIFTLMVIWFIKTSHKRYFLYTISGIVFVVILLLNFLPVQLIGRYLELIGTAKGVPKDVVSDYTVFSRMLFWKKAIATFLLNIRTFFIGVGTGGFSRVLYHLDIRWYPHNIIFEVLSEMGIIGIILLFFQFFFVLRDGIRNLFRDIDKETKVIYFSFIMVIFFNLITVQFSGDLNDNRRLWFYLGSLVALNISAKEKAKQS